MVIIFLFFKPFIYKKKFDESFNFDENFIKKNIFMNHSDNIQML